MEDKEQVATKEELIERFAKIQNISIEEANDKIGAETAEEVLKNLQDFTLNKIRNTQVPMNRAQRRALKKKVGAKKYAEMVAESGDITTAVSETAAKLNYIDLIQKLRKLNEEKGEQDYGEDDDEEN